MSRLLAIDTSSPQTLWCGVEDSAAVDPVLVEGTNKHDTVLADGVRSWLDEHDGWRDSLDGIAVVVGPGGFTGLRVGVAFAAGLAEALQLPVVPVETPRLLAARVEDGLVWAIHRAGGKLVKGQVVRGGLEFVTLSDLVEFAPRDAVPVPEVNASGQTDNKPLLPLGEGYELFRDAIDTALGERLRRDAVLRSAPDALALSAARVFADNGAVSPLDVDVVYGSEFRPTPKPGS
ncbi:tRNA (adenosine(37)-N6)-threonylcarbamoyltransferase complex dimerization subunit type 1 TsaB [bacterium]|nr:tRNA (adenosine(37)-N6)-threonylcarbamoyltransferase complex dimerization subunit type 1 TsaB [bacterium]